MRTIRSAVLAAAIGAASVFPLVAHADDKGHSHGAKAGASDMADGEVRKVDKEANKITLKHGDIKNLDMPGMTMVFQVKDPAMLDKVQQGDKVKFKAEKANNAIVLTEIQVAK